MMGKDIFLGLEYLDETYIDQAENGVFSKKAFYQEDVHRPPRVFLLTAVIILLCLLVGCGIVYMLSMEDLEIGQTQVITETGVSGNGETSVKTEVFQILTFSGVKGSANFQAAQAWLAFEDQFDADGSIQRESFLQSPALPEDCDAYSIYSQAQAEKLAEIASRYGLTLAGPKVSARSPRSLLAYLNIENLLLPEAPAKISNLVTEYYENGKFYADFYLLMDTRESSWPHDTFCLYHYTPKTCFDDYFVYLAENGDWREWNYTTAAGEPVLILRSDSREEAYIFRDLDTATVAVKIYTNVFQDSMTDSQLQQIVDTLRFSLAPQPGDPAMLEGFGTAIDASAQKQTQNGTTVELKSIKTDGQKACITLGITAPEGTSLKNCDIHPGNRGEGLLLPKDKRQKIPGLYANWCIQEDSDGQEHTQNLLIIADPHTMDTSIFTKDGLWSLYLEGLDISTPGSMLQQDIHTRLVGVWQFDISFAQGDFRTLECIQKPVTVLARTGQGEREAVQLISFQLRSYSASATFAQQAGDLNDYTGNTVTRPCAVLQDGSRIDLHHAGGPGLVTGLQAAEEIPLDEVAYVLLADGTKLSPQH